jgi:pimeloyl-ACP methyl ester carboxylesterase
LLGYSAHRPGPRDRGNQAAYDQAGYGQSDLPDTPYDIREEIAGLWRGLDQLALYSSLTALGHSYRGLPIQVLAGEHPTVVRGLVFVDPTNIEFIDALGGIADRTSHPLAQRPFDPSWAEELTKPQRAALRVEVGLPGTVAIVRAMPVPQDVPVRVITAGKPWLPKPENNQARREGHEHLAASVKDGKLFVAERSAHSVPYDQPKIVVTAVAELVRDAGA